MSQVKFLRGPSSNIKNITTPDNDAFYVTNDNQQLLVAKDKKLVPVNADIIRGEKTNSIVGNDVENNAATADNASAKNGGTMHYKTADYKVPTTAGAKASHVEGQGGIVSNADSGNQAQGSHVEGSLGISLKKLASWVDDIDETKVAPDGNTYYVHKNYTEGRGSHVEGCGNKIIGTRTGAHAEGYGNLVKGNNGHAEGYETQALSNNTHTEGRFTQATQEDAHAEGFTTVASNYQAHAEGSRTTASGSGSHAEGYMTTASGEQAHSEGGGTTASGDRSHAEGSSTTASGNRSHAEGAGTVAAGAYSHAEGANTIANGECQHVAGQWNVADSTSVRITGWGTDGKRKNIEKLDRNGNLALAGSLTLNMNGESVTLTAATVKNLNTIATYNLAEVEF